MRSLLSGSLRRNASILQALILVDYKYDTPVDKAPTDPNGIIIENALRPSDQDIALVDNIITTFTNLQWLRFTASDWFQHIQTHCNLTYASRRPKLVVAIDE
jgi:hypothetical protein